MNVSPQFTQRYEKYIDDATSSFVQDYSEAQKRSVFLDFLSNAFGIDMADVVLETTTKIKRAQITKRGYIDALFGDVVYEFKRDLADQNNLPTWREQLREYLVSKRDETKIEHIGILTDTIRFEVHRLDGDKLALDTNFTLEKSNSEAAFIHLDTYLFSQKQLAPTARDIVARFGSNSPTFRTLYQHLVTLYETVKKSRYIDVWREQWDKLLSKVYGSPVGSDELFLRHTFLSQFAKILAYSALQDAPPTDTATVEQILNGTAFLGYGVKNISENDFYSWVLQDSIKTQVVDLFRRLSLGLVVYDLSRIDQDLLKELYESLVEQKVRHGLGEYYTPDWLAELTIEDINYQYPQSFLDPACGSGTFLFSAIKHLEKQGLEGWSLVEFAKDNIMGMDVHPLAVSTSRLNYLLALSPHMRERHPQGKTREMNIPVYMADALLRPLENEGADALTIAVSERDNEFFKIPYLATMSASALSDAIYDMERFAKFASDRGDTLQKSIIEGFTTKIKELFGDIPNEFILNWIDNLKLLAKLMHEERNGIWAYILNNQSRPLIMAQKRFDMVVGNPPWLSYRYIDSEAYQEQVKSLYQYYKLIDSGDVQLFPQMDLSTLFWNLAKDRYLKVGGTIAYVLPRAVITGAKQHRPFQKQGFTRVLDMLDIRPLIFNVPTCTLIAEGDNLHTDEIPSKVYHGRFRAREMKLDEVRSQLSFNDGKTVFVDSDIRSPHYYEQVFQGATLVPRNLVFVTPSGYSSSRAVMTDPDMDKDAQEPWQGVSISGLVDADYIYMTLLSKHLVPFGFGKMHMITLPVYQDENHELHMLTKEEDFIPHFDSWKWFKQAYDIREKLKKDTTSEDFFERLNYHNTLTNQDITQTYKVLYTASGVHLASVVINQNDYKLIVNNRSARGFVVESKTYCFDAFSADESHYLCALLNSQCVDDAIKPYQSRGKGKIGQRDIHRTPFEACAIPPFDAMDIDHMALAELSKEAHNLIERFKVMGGLDGYVSTIRKRARKEAKEQLKQIDVIARRVIGLD